MVVVKLYGGLGNQMFQYAAGLVLAARLETTVHADTTWFSEHAHPNGPPRTYELAPFGVRRGPSLRARLAHRVRRPTVFRESTFGYDERFEMLRGDVVLDGYWQSYRYWTGDEDVIRTAFRFPEPASSDGRRLRAAISATTTPVSIHVRRGDYETNAKINATYGLLELEYYARAAQRIAEHVPEPSFFVFSDDIGWCRTNLRLDHETTFVQTPAAAAYEDLALITLCSHHVIANSSYGWWGAWLGEHPNKVVIAPTRWYRDATADTSDLIPPEWIRL